MKDDVAAMESIGRDEFKYANDLTFEGVKVDRILRDGDTVTPYSCIGSHSLSHARTFAFDV